MVCCLGRGSRGLGVSGVSTYAFGGDGTPAWSCPDSPQETDAMSAKLGGLSLGQGVLTISFFLGLSTEAVHLARGSGVPCCVQDTTYNYNVNPSTVAAHPKPQFIYCDVNSTVVACL